MVVVYLYLNMKTQEIFVIHFSLVTTYCNIHMVITVHNRISIFMH